MNKEIYYVYIYRDIDGRVIYVGKGKGTRAWFHLNAKSHLGNVLRKRLREGYQIEPEFLCKDVDEEFAFFIEIETIRHFGRKDLGLGTLFNLTDGGEGSSGHIDSAETKIKRSQGQMGNTIWLGKSHTDDTLKLMRESRAKQVFSPETIKKLDISNKFRATVKTECPHCNLFFDAANMSRWHGIRCKLNPYK